MAHILVADDDLRLQSALAAWLTKAGYRVTLASDGRETLEHLQREIPDVLFLDLMMPWMDGFEVLKALREDAATQELPVILLATGAAEVNAHWEWGGTFTDVLDKPVRPAEGKPRLERILRTRRAAPKVLVVTAEDAIRAPAWALQDAGLRMALAQDREEALQYVARCPPDLVVLDQALPRTDELLRQLAEDPRHSVIPVLLLLSPEADAAPELRRARMSRLYKPVPATQLVLEVDRLLAGVSPPNPVDSAAP